MVKKRKLGWAPTGQNHQSAKLTDHEVELIRRFRKGGWALQKLADKFEISKTQVRNIVDWRQRL